MARQTRGWGVSRGQGAVGDHGARITGRLESLERVVTREVFVPTHPPRKVMRNRGRPPEPPAGGAAPCTPGLPSAMLSLSKHAMVGAAFVNPAPMRYPH